MAPRVTFANYPNGLQPIPAALDTAFDDALKLTIIPCTATGTNTIALTPIASVYPPTLTAYVNYIQFSFVPANSTTGSATVNVNGVGAKNLYLNDGTTQAGSGDLVAGRFYTIAYSSSLNSSAGGFYVSGATTLVSPILTRIELGHASDTTLSRASAGVLAVEGVNVLLNGGALGTPSSGTLTNATGLPIAGLTASTSTALGVGSIELGHASDTTIARVSAGVISVEGVNVLLNGGALGTPSSGTLTNATGLPSAAGITGATTWTPALKFGGAAVSLTTSVAAGRIIQLGNGTIIATGRITLTAKGSSTGAATITGLPTNAGGIEGNVRFSYYTNLASITSVPFGYVAAGGATINLLNSGAASIATLSEANFTNTSDFIFAVVYHTN